MRGSGRASARQRQHRADQDEEAAARAVEERAGAFQPRAHAEGEACEQVFRYSVTNSESANVVAMTRNCGSRACCGSMNGERKAPKKSSTFGFAMAESRPCRNSVRPWLSGAASSPVTRPPVPRKPRADGARILAGASPAVRPLAPAQLRPPLGDVGRQSRFPGRQPSAQGASLRAGTPSASRRPDLAGSCASNAPTATVIRQFGKRTRRRRSVLLLPRLRIALPVSVFLPRWPGPSKKSGSSARTSEK